MIPTSYIEQDFVIGNNQVFREHEMVGYATNAVNALVNAHPELKYNLNFDYYINMIEKAVSNLVGLSIDPEHVEMFKKYARDARIDAAGGLVKELLNIDSITIRPKYLLQMTDNIGLTIDRATRGSISKQEIKRYVSSEITNKVKRQMVRSDIPVDTPLKKVVRLGAPNMVPFTCKYINGYPYDFIIAWDAIKKGVLSEAYETESVVRNVRDMFSTYITALNELIRDSKWNEEDTRKLYYILHNATRELLDATAYLSFMVIRKIGLVANNIVRSNAIFDRMSSIVIPVSEGVLDTLMIKNDSKTLGDDLLNGNIDAFDEIANRIYEYHKGLYEDSPFDDGKLLDTNRLITPLDMRLDHAEYNRTVYDEIGNMYKMINHGLGVIAKNSDDYLVVFDDIVDKSGFMNDLNDRFSGILSMIDDISEYESAVSVPSGAAPEMFIYFRMLKEIKDFPENMAAVAKAAKECNDALHMLLERFDRNINTEYSNTLTVAEVVAFLHSLIEQFINLNISVSSKFMLRLKNIAVCLEKFNKQKSDDLQNNSVSIESTTVLGKSIFGSSCEISDSITDILFEAMIESYTIASVKDNTGITMVVESSKASDIAVKIKAALVRWYEKVDEKLTKLIKSPKAEENNEFVKSHKNDLLNKSYSNAVSPNPIIEYEKLCPADTITKDMKFLIKNTSSVNLKSDKLISVSDEESASTIIFGNRIPTSVWTDGEASRNIAKYYKCGTYPENPVEIKNGNLKKMVEDAIKFCEDFYEKFIPSIKESITLIKDNIANNTETLLTESHVDYLIGSMFVEADDDANASPTAGDYQSMDSTKSSSNDNSGDSASSSDSSTNTQQSDASSSASTDNSANTDSGSTTTDTSDASSSSDSSSASTDNSSSGSSDSSSNASDKAKKLSEIAKKIEMIQKMAQKYCNGILTASFDRYKDYMNLLKGLAGESTNAPKSSTDAEAAANDNNGADTSSDNADNGGETPQENQQTDQNQDQTQAQPEQPQEAPQADQGSSDENNSGGNDDVANVDDTGLFS